MEIKIDTSKDEVEHIEHMITFLQNFVNANRAANSRTAYGTQSSDSDSEMGGMFDLFNQATDNSGQKTDSSSAPSEGLFGLFNSQEPTNSEKNKESEYRTSSAAQLLEESDDFDEQDEDKEEKDDKQRIEIIPY